MNASATRATSPSAGAGSAGKHARSGSRSAADHNQHGGYTGHVETITSVSVYRSDLDWLKRKQLEMSASKGEALKMPEFLHELFEAIRHEGEGA